MFHVEHSCQTLTHVPRGTSRTLKLLPSEIREFSTGLLSLHILLFHDIFSTEIPQT